MQYPFSRRTTILAFLLPATVLLMLVGLWTWWAERHLDQEHALRNQIQDYLEHMFPGQMQGSSGQYGLFRHDTVARSDGQQRVVLVHGLDEPGGIWHDLVPVLETMNREVWEFRYPNDQAIGRSVQQLADSWSDLDGPVPVVMIGHSMGGLVIRDFVSRLRHPVDASPVVEGPPVSGVLLVGTPSQGSDWARLRMWLELREFFITTEDRRFSLFAALRDGTGAAKVDLHPDSAFLAELNGRDWPQSVPVRIIGGKVPDIPPDLDPRLQAISDDLVPEDIEQAIVARLSDIGESVGDGAVPASSLAFLGGPEPILVPASHRGLLVRRNPSDPEPPAVRYIVESLRAWETGRY
jgi:pimeloyl-ACP methyl ester carboxylesterase